VLWGETHPEVRRREGERYRNELRDRAKALGIADRVRFFDRYMTDDEVVAVLLATDVYVSPSLDPHQAVSGTLSYAVACGRAVVATEYQYAKELLADGRGITVPFRDAEAVATAVVSLLDDRGLRTSIETAAYRFGRQMTWPKIALGYRHAFSASILAGLGVEPAAIGA
jgi:glycosyltransferase involved in cell wall biosynthesis